MAKNVRAGVVLEKNILPEERAVFAGGFYDFVVFCGGKSVVSLWWDAW
jgi:hypothetical protein